MSRPALPRSLRERAGFVRSAPFLLGASALGLLALAARIAPGHLVGLTVPDLSVATLLGLAAPTSLTFPCWTVTRRALLGRSA